VNEGEKCFSCYFYQRFFYGGVKKKVYGAVKRKGKLTSNIPLNY
jgi:hypothetical protein